MLGLFELANAIDAAEARLADACRAAGVPRRRCRRLLEGLQDGGFSRADAYAIVTSEIEEWRNGTKAI